MHVQGLEAGTVYSFYLSVCNAVDFGKAAHFRVETPLQNVPSIRIGITRKKPSLIKQLHLGFI